MGCIHWRAIPRSAACLLASMGLLAAATGALAEDHLKLAVGGQRGVGETFPTDVGQQAGIFKKHGLDLDVLYTESSGETLQAVISGSVQIGVATGFIGTIGVFAKGARCALSGRLSPAVANCSGMFAPILRSGRCRIRRAGQWPIHPRALPRIRRC